MRFHVLTLFPEMIEQGFHTSITKRAAEDGRISLHTVNIRDYTENKHKKVDDYPYGGGAGMLMQAQPVYDAFQSIQKEGPLRVVYVTPQGRTFTQEMAEELVKEKELVFLCGHYEGIDERVLEEIVTDYISIGDYVLTGGELPAMVMMDAIARLVPQVLHNGESAEFESFHNHLLEYPHYSRPSVWHDKSVPKVLLSGDHKQISQWRQEQSEARTKERRPDLYEKYRHQQRTIAYLMQDKLLHMGMIQALQRGSARLLYADTDGVLLQEKKSGSFQLTAGSARQGEAILTQYADLIQGSMLIVCGEELEAPVRHILGWEHAARCRQAVYTRGVPLSVPQTVSIRSVRADELTSLALWQEIGEQKADREELVCRVDEGALFGAYLENGLCIGMMGELLDGSMGMLYVGWEYRRKKVASALEADCMNRLLRLGKIPYGRIGAEQEAVWNLQEKLGLRISKRNLLVYSGSCNHWLTD